jgi:hypothetical protein
LLDSRERAATEAGAGLWIDQLPPQLVENIGNSGLLVIAVEVKR